MNVFHFLLSGRQELNLGSEGCSLLPYRLATPALVFFSKRHRLNSQFTLTAFLHLCKSKSFGLTAGLRLHLKHAPGRIGNAVSKARPMPANDLFMKLEPMVQTRTRQDLNLRLLASFNFIRGFKSPFYFRRPTLYPG